MHTASKSNTLILLIHEKYGINDHMLSVGDRIKQNGMNVLIPNLLQREGFVYEQEAQAYRYFMDSVGFERGKQRIASIVTEQRERYERILLMGYSVGATLAWMCSTLPVDGIIGYYGSRIRDALDIEPACPALLFFASEEKSFHVPTLLAALKDKPHTIVEIVNAKHGFMNPFDASYDEGKSRQCLATSLAFIHRIIAL
ncbi:dienelactone hydrolase family protein [Paenibacillus sp. 1001270B_150601_E10]|uniref:dienelactone hydrolase family protein n=1 Tax=Paenibacillus sp. 1001270B_150601_E10 TaxID=2787079 RepID=UPI00189CDA3F|nr:dienelactone hydrolase family protein [Paenibacillus sp. 1001270B_150601_E10]